MKNPVLILCLLSILLTGCDSDEPADGSDTRPPQDVTQTASGPDAVTGAVDSPSPADGEPPAEQAPASTPAAMDEPAEAPAPAVEQAMSGEQVFKKYCMACHMTGAANAPRVGDAEAWAPRIDKGMDALLMSAVNGVPNTAMLPAGGCGACSEEELKAAIEFMINQSR